MSEPVTPLREWVIVLCPSCGVECMAPVMRRYAEWGTGPDKTFRLLLDTTALERHALSHYSPLAPAAAWVSEVRPSVTVEYRGYPSSVARTSGTPVVEWERR